MWRAVCHESGTYGSEGRRHGPTADRQGYGFLPYYGDAFYDGRIWWKINIMYNKNFNSYLAGLIEGDGYLLCPSKLNKVYKPKIGIAGHLKDLKFYEWLSKNLGYGVIKRGSSGNSIIWEVKEELNIKDLCLRTKNYYRTGKIERMNKLLDYYGWGLVKLDKSSILSNGWLAGMSDADSNFNVIIGNRKKAGKLLKVNLQWRLEMSIKTSNNINNLDICQIISEGLNTKVLMRIRKANLEKSKKEEYFSLMVICFSEIQKDILENYFNKYKLLTSKRNDYENWRLIRKLNHLKLKTISIEEKLKLIEKSFLLKNKMNNSNIIPNWEHLKEKNIYYI